MSVVLVSLPMMVGCFVVIRKFRGTCSQVFGLFWGYFSLSFFLCVFFLCLGGSFFKVSVVFFVFLYFLSCMVLGYLLLSSSACCSFVIIS